MSEPYKGQIRIVETDTVHTQWDDRDDEWFVHRTQHKHQQFQQWNGAEWVDVPIVVEVKFLGPKPESVGLTTPKRN